MIEVKMYCRLIKNPICESATLFYDPETKVGLYVVRHLTVGNSPKYIPLDLNISTLIYEALNDGEHEEVIRNYFRKKGNDSLYPITKVNNLMWALKLGRTPLDTIERFNKNGYLYDGKIGG